MNIGQPVWTSFGSLLKGVILSIHSSPDYVIMEYPDGEKRTCTSSFLHATQDEAKRACEEHAEYWQRQAELLNPVFEFPDGDELPRLHGHNCHKVLHTPAEYAKLAEGWQHQADDDSPYFVDGCRYCGRCHVAI